MPEEALIAGLEGAVGAELARRAVRRRFGRGEEIYRQGERPCELFLLLSGRVKVWRATESGGAFTLTLLGPGSIVGTLGASISGANPTTATAITGIEVMSWRIYEVRRAMAADSALSGTLLRAVTDIATEMIGRLEEVSAVAVEQRLARVLLRAGSTGDEEAGTAGTTLPLSRQDLADLAFSTLPTVSRIMSRWRTAGLVDGGRGKVKLLDRVALTEVAEVNAADEGAVSRTAPARP